MLQSVSTGHLSEVRRDYKINYAADLLDGVKPNLITAGTLQIHLLGRFMLTINDVPASNLGVSRLQSLLAYLALHRNVPQERSRIAFSLWPDSTESQAHTNLRNLLYKLRAILPDIDAFLVIRRQMLCWQANVSWNLDVADFEHAITQAKRERSLHDLLAERQILEEAVKLYQGDLLPSCYDDWIQDERYRLQQIFLDTLERLIILQEQEHNYLEAIGMAQCLLRHDCLHETAYHHLMRLYALRGDRGAISRTYRTYVAVLKRELAVEPDVATRQIYEQLMRAES